MRNTQRWNLVALAVLLAVLALLFRGHHAQTSVTLPPAPGRSPLPALGDDPATRLARTAIDLTLQKMDVRQNPNALKFGQNHEVVRYDDPQHPGWYGEVQFGWPTGLSPVRPGGRAETRETGSVVNLTGYCRMGGFGGRLVHPGTALIVAHGQAGAAHCDLLATFSIVSDRGPVTGDWLDRCGHKSYLGELGSPELPNGEWFPDVMDVDTPTDWRISQAVCQAMAGDSVFWKCNSRGPAGDLNLESNVATTGNPNGADFCTHVVAVAAVVYDPGARQFVRLQPESVTYFKCPRNINRYEPADAADYDAASAPRGFTSQDVVRSMTKAQLAFADAANQALRANRAQPNASDTCPIFIQSIERLPDAPQPPITRYSRVMAMPPPITRLHTLPMQPAHRRWPRLHPGAHVDIGPMVSPGQ